MSELSLRQKMNMEEKSIYELLDKILFLAYTDEEKLQMLKYIKDSRLRYLEYKKEYETERYGQLQILNRKTSSRWKR